MDSANFILRGISLLLIISSLYFSIRASGPSIFNVPLWNGIGVFVLYIVYLMSGIDFENGDSIDAELILTTYIFISVFSFAIGERLARRWKGRTNQTLNLYLQEKHSIPSVPWHIIIIYLILFSVFILILSRGNLLTIFTSAPELKLERLKAIAEKSPLLLNLDQGLLALSILLLSWLILEIRPDYIPVYKLIISCSCLIIYIISTGSRSPLVAIILQIVVNFRLVRLRFTRASFILRSKRLRVAIICLSTFYLIYTTYQRMSFEGLDLTIFTSYFHATSLGSAEILLSQSNPFSFLLGTVIVYFSATFNNYVLRFQELVNIIPTFGYRFSFFYVSAFKILFPGLDYSWLDDWQDLGKSNWSHLEAISMSAGQWSMSYGDLIWDYGIIVTYVIVLIWGICAGFIFGKTKSAPSFKSILALAVFTGFSLFPLVNPFLSLYVQYILVILFLMWALPWPARRLRNI